MKWYGTRIVLLVATRRLVCCVLVALWAGLVQDMPDACGVDPDNAESFSRSAVTSQEQPYDDTPDMREYDPSTRVYRIPGEQPNGVAERVYLHYGSADVALRSYATADIGGCTGTMIGPNVLLTAAHCNTRNRDATFYVYTDANTKLQESFACEYMMHTFPDMDLLLYWVEPNAAGDNPGDKYGYVDFDIEFDPSESWTMDYTGSRARITANMDLYSVWTNPIDSLGGGWHAIYSKGNVTETNTPGHWASPNIDNNPDFQCSNGWCVGGTNAGVACGTCMGVDPGCPGGTCERRPSHNLGVTTNLWSNGGASGSSQLSPSTHRISAAPLSIGTTNARLRRSPAIADYLYWASTDRANTQSGACRECDVDQVNEALLSRLGVANPRTFYGWTDLDINGVFDVHQFAELARGEDERDWYWLGFESHRRNLLWTRRLSDWSKVSFDSSDPLAGDLTVTTVGQTQPGYIPVIQHQRLNLTPGTTYRVSFKVLLVASAEADPIRLCLDQARLDCHIVPPSVGALEAHTFSFVASSEAILQFEFKRNALAVLSDVSIVADGAVADFNTFDKREPWRNDNYDTRALVWPNGPASEGPGGVADWAGVVRRDPVAPMIADWSLATAHMALDDSYDHRICFDFRSPASAPLILAAGRIRVIDEANPRVVPGSELAFSPTDAWQYTCTSWFTGVDDNRLQFGVQAGHPSATGLYLVDNIRVEAVPRTIYVDWRNTGNEDGSQVAPYNTVTEGVGAAAIGGDVIVADGTYPERLTVARRMTLRSSGGPAVIGGQP